MGLWTFCRRRWSSLRCWTSVMEGRTLSNFLSKSSCPMEKLLWLFYPKDFFVRLLRLRHKHVFRLQPPLCLNPYGKPRETETELCLRHLKQNQKWFNAPTPDPRSRWEWKMIPFSRLHGLVSPRLSHLQKQTICKTIRKSSCNQQETLESPKQDDLKEKKLLFKSNPNYQKKQKHLRSPHSSPLWPPKRSSYWKNSRNDTSSGRAELGQNFSQTRRTGGTYWCFPNVDWISWTGNIFVVFTSREFFLLGRKWWGVGSPFGWCYKRVWGLVMVF